MALKTLTLPVKPAYSVEIDPETRFIFSPSGSPSSIAQKNDTLKAIGCNVVYMTFPHPITAAQYAGLIRSPITLGAAVTGQGLKSAIIQELDELEPLAEKLRSVNTVVNDKGHLTGYNTDAAGFEKAITEGIRRFSVQIERAVVYGNGGVSGVAVAVLQKLGIAVTLAGRNPQRVAAKMSELSLNTLRGPFDLVVNATPISSRPVAEATGLMPLLEGAKLIFDHNMPEKDNQTNYLKAFCESRRLPFIPGGEMYIPQLVLQWEIFLGHLRRPDGTAWVSSEEIAYRVLADS